LEIDQGKPKVIVTNDDKKSHFLSLFSALPQQQVDWNGTKSAQMLFGSDHGRQGRGNMVILLFILIRMNGMKFAKTYLENYKILKGYYVSDTT